MFSIGVELHGGAKIGATTWAIGDIDFVTGNIEPYACGKHERTGELNIEAPDAIRRTAEQTVLYAFDRAGHRRESVEDGVAETKGSSVGGDPVNGIEVACELGKLEAR